MLITAALLAPYPIMRRPGVWPAMELRQTMLPRLRVRTVDAAEGLLRGHGLGHGAQAEHGAALIDTDDFVVRRYVRVGRGSLRV